MRGVYLEDSPPTDLFRHTPTVVRGYRGQGGNASNAIPAGGRLNTRTASTRTVQNKRRKRR